MHARVEMDCNSRNKREFGNIGEEIAAEFLRKKGYQLIERNFRAGRLGEIDIIAFKDEYICFIEVKCRSGTRFGRPSESIDRRKQKNIIKLASVYMSRRGIGENNVRFDVVEVMISENNNAAVAAEINHITNAFQL